MLIGAHVGGDDVLAAAHARDADLVQLFIGDPQTWKPPLPRADTDQLRSAEMPVYVHAPYLINVGSPNNRIRIPSRKNLAQAAADAEAVGATALIVHGGHVGDDEDLSVGYERWRKALDSFETSVRILIENTAGGGEAIARSLENYGPLWEHIGEYNVGICLDTCHAWAAGEDLATAVEVIESVARPVELVHCNDSRDPHDSGRDRHANLGAGEIPEELLMAVVTSAGVPVVVETPGGAADQAADVAWIRSRL